MRPRERRETGEQDLFRSRLDQIIDVKHAVVKLAHATDWRSLEEKFGIKGDSSRTTGEARWVSAALNSSYDLLRSTHRPSRRHRPPHRGRDA